MAEASYLKRFKISVDNSTWLDTSARSATLNFNGQVLDDTTYVNNAGFHSRLLGLLDWSLDIELIYEASDTALTNIRNSLLNRSDLYMQYLPRTTVANGGYTGKVIVESFNSEGDVEGLEMVSVTLQGSGALATAS